MRNNRLFYFLLILGIIILGMLSRKIEAVPLFVGDMLYAVMIYFLFRFLFLKVGSKKIAVLALLTCYTIEILQLYQADWINNIRATTLGHLILGQRFLWSDIIAYTVGIGIAYTTEIYLNRKSERLDL